MSSNKSKMDPIHITQTAYDEDAQAHRVLMIPTDMEINVSAEDGDSVHSISKMQVIECEAGQVVDTSSARRMQIIGAAVSCVMVINGSEIAMSVSGITEICTPAIKVNKACIVILQS